MIYRIKGRNSNRVHWASPSGSSLVTYCGLAAPFTAEFVSGKFHDGVRTGDNWEFVEEGVVNCPKCLHKTRCEAAESARGAGK